MEAAPDDLTSAPKSSRYQIYGLVGRGASGLVYKALDLTEHFPLALKSLKSLTPEEIYHLKTEFRALQDVYHPNLVQLFNLYVQDDQCYFTMELVEGTDFVSYVRSSAPHDDERYIYDSLLRPALGQLGEGLEALHGKGILHRDLKPTNVLVTPDGRTVLLDFGLSVNTETGAGSLTQSRVLAGTPSYMAPELFHSQLPTTASDWYSVGAILYESLTGRCPFPDSQAHLETFLAAKRAGPPDPSQLNPVVPDDLRELTLALLEWSPDNRAGAEDVARCCRQSGRARAPDVAATVRSSTHDVFVGRHDQLRQLQDALEHSIADGPRLVFVAGEPGVGKTSLIERFISAVSEPENVLILRSNCHAQEEVRYKAIDGLVDHLSHHLKSLRSDTLEAITPASLLALTKVFPVLARVPFKLPADYEEPSADPRVNVNRAFTALRELLEGVARERPTIVWIDDFQWADQASIQRLSQLMDGLLETAGQREKASREPVILMVISYREGEGGPQVEELLGEKPDLASQSTIQLGPLDADESHELLAELLDDVPSEWLGAFDVLSGQAAGLPLFIIELAGFIRDRKRDSGTNLDQGWSFDSILRERLASLPPAHQKLLRLVALSPRPIPDDLLKLAADFELAGYETHTLCRQRLLRRRVADGWPAIETYHDRIRQAILAAGGDEDKRARQHRQIGQSLRGLLRRRYRDGRIDRIDLPMLARHYESLIEHFLGAGEFARVSRYAVAAAKIASSRLAFDHAAGLLELALSHRRRKSSDWPLRARYALALANVGRAAESAAQYVKVAQSMQQSSATDGVDPDRLLLATQNVRAAEQFLYAGMLTDGFDVLREVFRDLRLPFPLPGRRARAISYCYRLPFLPVTFGLRRFHPRRRDETVDPSVRLRLDTLWIAAKGTLMLDYAVGDVISSRYLKEALQFREPSRALRAMGLEASVYANIGGEAMLRRSKGLMRLASKLAADGESYDRALMHICATSIAWCEGRWDCVARPAQDALKALAQCAGTNFDIAIVQGFALSARAFLGDIKGIAEELPALLEDAEQRGDHYTRSVFQSGYLVYLYLAKDDPEGALVNAGSTVEQAPSDRFTSLHFHYFNAYITAQLYAGESWKAWSHVIENWPRIKTAGFLRLGCIGANLLELRARAAIAAASSEYRTEPGEAEDGAATAPRWTPDRLLGIAEHDARQVARRSLPHTSALAAVIRAGIAAARGLPSRQREQLVIARDGFRAAGMAMHEEATRLRLSSLDQAGKERDEVISMMGNRRILNPEKMARVLVPG